ncbi:MAG: tetratricopeptide repeat protein [Myxococcota bacterium]
MTIEEPLGKLDDRGQEDGQPEDGQQEKQELDTVDRQMARLFREPVGPMPDDGSPTAAGRVSSVVSSALALRGRTLGRYLLIGELGSGGMGTVLKAYDESLDRAVAIKLLHSEAAERHTERLRREAQALAKLSHPNVVQVYEVGQHDGQWFIAMEMVRGQTLREWQQTPRGWRECVETYLQAGAGLVAAHAAGLVHRDFKPDNCIVDRTGRPRVLDFGLVSGDAEPALDVTSEEIEAIGLGGGALESSLTESGTVLGTPAYMPPEQMRGEGADARSDQFSFCVSFYEAIYGERPFEGGTLPRLLEAVSLGAVRSTPKGVRVPGSLRQILVRGLAAEPIHRWSSMEELLAELRRLVAPRRARWLALSASIVVGLGLMWVGQAYQADVGQRCTGARAELDGIWDDARRQEVEAAVLGTEVSYAPATWKRVEQRLDDYADAWMDKHTEVCEATSIRGEQSEEAMDLRMQCLGKRRTSLRASVDVLADADAEVVENAVKLVAGLSVLTRCDDLDWLEQQDQRMPPPEDPEVAAEVEALRERLAEVGAMYKAGRYAEGLKRVEPLVQKARKLGYSPLLAEALDWQGWLRSHDGQYARAEEDLRRSHALAVEHHHDEIALDTAQALTIVVGAQLDRHAEGRQWGQMVALPLAQRNDDPASLAMSLNNLGSVYDGQGAYEDARNCYARALRISTDSFGVDHLHAVMSLNNLGNVYKNQGEYEKAEAYYGQVLRALENVVGAEHPYVADVLNNLGNVNESQGEYGEARDFHAQALEIRKETLGAGHPHVASSLNNLGSVYLHQGNYEEAKACHQRALEIRIKVLGDEHPHVTYSLNNLGNVYVIEGEYEKAKGYYERALEVRRKVLGEEHPDVALSLNNLGVVYDSKGEYREAKECYERALSIREKVLGAEHPDVASTLSNLGSVCWMEKEYDGAREYYERALSIREKVLGAEHPDVASTLSNLGNVYLIEGKYDKARGGYERALEIREKALGADHSDVASSLVGLAMVALGKSDSTSARAHAERAVSIREVAKVAPELIAEARFVLAQALWSKRHERARARALAVQARDALAAAGGPGWSDVDLDEVDAWLATHRIKSRLRSPAR